MEPQDEYGLTHVTLPEFLNTMYDMSGEFDLDYDTDCIMEKLRQLVERKEMGGNKGIHLSYEKGE